MRLDRKLKEMRMRARQFEYLMSHPVEHIKSKMEEFSLSGFQRRMEQNPQVDSLTIRKKENFSY